MDDELIPLFANDNNNNNNYDSDSSSDTSDYIDDDAGGDNEGGSENRRNARSCPNISYDTSLPAQHSYLGNDLEELSGRTVLDDNSCQTIPILSLPGVILVPGQTLPLQLYHPATVSMMLNIIRSDRTFGMVNSRFSGRTFGNMLDVVGTTAEIRSYREEGGEDFSLTTLRILAEGRQRFQLLETRRRTDGMTSGKVKILPEIDLGDPGAIAKLKSLDRFRTSPVCPSDGSSSAPSVIRPHMAKDKYSFTHCTYFPSFVYRQYDPELLMNRIKSQLKDWNESLKMDYMPPDALAFSYWVASNLPLDDNQRISLLSVNNVVQRLRYELQILEQCSVLQCRDCHCHIADRKDIFSMSLRGPQGTYVNSNGYVHEAITLYQAKGLYLTGRPSTAHSWFPGYAWTIVECQLCHSHMGWKFTAVDKKLQPTKFWALCRSSLTANIQPNPIASDEPQPE